MQRKIIGPLTDQLKKGADPITFTRSIAAGLTIGVIPTPFITGFICAAVALAFRLNMVAIQVAQLVMAPVQLAMLIPLMRAGEYIVGSTAPTKLEDVTRFTKGDFAGSSAPPTAAPAATPLLLQHNAVQQHQLYQCLAVYIPPPACSDWCAWYAVGAVWGGFLCAILAWALLAPFLYSVCRRVVFPMVKRVTAKTKGEINIGRKYNI